MVSVFEATGGDVDVSRHPMGNPADAADTIVHA
jgi:hypothetical protein